MNRAQREEKNEQDLGEKSMPACVPACLDPNWNRLTRARRLLSFHGGDRRIPPGRWVSVSQGLPVIGSAWAPWR